MGDFSLYINNAEDANAAQFLDLLNALGLRQVIDASTYRCGSILGLAMVYSIDSPQVVNVKQAPISFGPLCH